jgi:hypothetical protein
MDESLVQVKASILERADLLRARYGSQARDSVAKLFEDVLVEDGRLYIPRSLPSGVQLGAANRCFHNAWTVSLMRKGFRYAEGYVGMGVAGHIVLAHGFVVDDEAAYECTFPEPASWYFGIEFDPLLLVVNRQTRAFSTPDDWVIDPAAALRRFEQGRVKGGAAERL